MIGSGIRIAAALPSGGGDWWLANETIDSGDVHQHLEDVAPTTDMDPAKSAGNPWSVALYTYWPATYRGTFDHLFESQYNWNVRMRPGEAYLDCATGNGTYEITPAGSAGVYFTVIATSDGTGYPNFYFNGTFAVQAYDVNPGITSNSKWASSYSGVQHWAHNLTRAAYYSIELSATQISNLHSRLTSG